MDLTIFQASHKGIDSGSKARKASGKAPFSSQQIACLFASLREALGPWACPWDIARSWIEENGEAILGTPIPSKEAWDQISSAHNGWKIHDPKRSENAFPEAFSRENWKREIMLISQSAWESLSKPSAKKR